MGNCSEMRLRLLQDMPVFGGVTDSVLRTLLARVPVVRVARNEYFFRQGEPGRSMFVLEHGKVAIIKDGEGHGYLLKYLERGDCFGEMALMDLFPRSASVVAVEDSAAIEIPTDALVEIQQKDLEQFTMIQMNMGREVSRRLREANERLFRARVEVEVGTLGVVEHEA